MSRKINILAYYLPQYHPIPENDVWWEPGFTEWTQVTKAKPLFKGHEQPKLPGELGFYDLRLPIVQEKQAELALEYGVDGFIYYQYWFGGGEMLLEKPAEAMLANKNIKLPFCFCWANESLRGIKHLIKSDDTLIDQTYPGRSDYEAYFNYLLPFFNDDRYIKVEGKPMFHVYKFHEMLDQDLFLNTFNELAITNGFPGIYFVATGKVDSELIKSTDLVQGAVGVDLFNELRYTMYKKFDQDSFLGKIESWYNNFKGRSHKAEMRRRPQVIDYNMGLNHMNIEFPNKKFIPCAVPNWDNSPRLQNQAMVMTNATPAAFEENLKKQLKEQLKHPENPPFLVIKSWNEWGEGNYLEPDRTFGRGWLEAVKLAKESVLGEI